ncbi:hypothetical protein FRC01_002163 [Tulasnella sp. 417]|nr:hypothetical protein FRC01_002163 [Tulasnella sp. 417]
MLTPVTRREEISMEVAQPGIILRGEVSTMDINQNDISIRWAVGGWGDEYGYHANFDDSFHWPHPGLPSLSRRADFYIDGPLEWSYDPAYVLGRDIYSAANHFTTKHPLNAFADRSYSTLFSAEHYVAIGVKVIDPETNLSLPISAMECDPQPGPSLTGWDIKSRFWQRNIVNETAPISPTYIIEIDLNVQRWKLFFEVLMGVMILFGSLVTLISTAYLIRTSWAGSRKVRVEEIVAIPLAVGTIIAALRAAFPPKSDLEVFLNEAIYYPCFVLVVWCVMAGVTATRSMIVELLNQLRSWGLGRPSENTKDQKQGDLDKIPDTAPKETGAVSSPVGGMATSGSGSAAQSPEGIEEQREVLR